MKVACVKAIHDPAVGTAQDGCLLADRPVASQRPLIDRQPRRRSIAVASIRFRGRGADSGVDVFRVFESLNWVENMRVAMDAVIETGKICEGTVCYTGDMLDPDRSKYDLAYHVRTAQDLKAAGAHVLGLKDMAGLLKPAGTLHVDDGAAKALRGGKSLLPAGVTKVEGQFDRGDAVLVRDAAGAEVARGLSAYSSEDARRACGRRSQELEAILGYRGRDELIHRDDLVVLP